MDPGAEWSMPPAAGPDTVRTFYVYEGTVGIGPHDLAASTGAVLRADEPVEVTAGSGGASAVVLQGRPIGEPVAQYGPFVMNTKAEIQQAFDDYRRTEFGGWPWPDDAPTHGREQARFARHVDGRVEEPAG
jgi:redox-sensitive bicupin YhaK (pirin superfamily)